MIGQRVIFLVSIGKSLLLFSLIKRIEFPPPAGDSLGMVPEADITNGRPHHLLLRLVDETVTLPRGGRSLSVIALMTNAPPHVQLLENPVCRLLAITRAISE